MNFKKILVVCAGNICRSPMGEAFFKQKLSDDYTVDSAGIVGLINHPADDKAIEVMKEVAIDISSHQGKKLTKDLMADFDLILVMTKRQVNDVTKQWPFSKGKVYRICEWQDEDVADPYKHEVDAFLTSRNMILQGVESWLEKI